MSQIIDIAKMYNIITAKLKHTQVPISIHDFRSMVELTNETEIRIRDCLKQLHKKGLVRKVPIVQNNGRERVGYEWASLSCKLLVQPEVTRAKAIREANFSYASTSNGGSGGSGKTLAIAEQTPALSPGTTLKTDKPLDDMRIKINPDQSVTIITKTIRITIEVPV